MTKLLTLFLFLFLLPALKAVAGASQTPNIPVSQCYHWLDEKSRKYLSFKYEYASKNKNELTFYTTAYTSNGAVAGPGLYCAKNPSGSYRYGDRAIKIEFVRDVVVLDATTGKQHCGLDGKFYSDQKECDQKPWDVKLYDRSNGWYLISNPMAIARWSSNSPQLIEDLQADGQAHGGNFLAHANRTIEMIKDEIAKDQSRIFTNGNARLDILKVIGENPRLLDSIPALHVLGQLLATQAEDLAENIKLKYIRYSLARVSLDPEIQYTDVVPFLQNPMVSTEIYRIAQQLINEPNTNQPLNSELLFMLYHNHGQQLSLTAEEVSALLKKVTVNPIALKRLMNPNLKLNELVLDQIKKKIETGFARTQNPEVLLTQRKFVITKFSDDNLAEQIKKRISQTLNSLDTSSEFRFVVGKEAYSASAKLDQLMIQCKVYGNLALEDQDNLNLSIEIPQRNFQFQLGTLKTSDTADLFCQNKQGILKSLIETLESKSDAKKFFISGKIENTPYMFAFEFFEDVEPQLTAFFQSQPTLSRVDEIYYSINGAPLNRYYSSRYLSQTQIIQAFKLILSNEGMTLKPIYEAQKEFLKNSTKAHTHLKVDVQGAVFDFYVATLEDLQSQCDAVLPHITNPRVHIIRITKIEPTKEAKNLESVENSNSRSYWRTPAEQCEAIRLATLKLSEPILSQMQLDILKKSANKEFKIEARFQNMLIRFMVDDREELVSQCESVVEELLSNIKVEQILLKINNEDRPRIYNGHSYWRTAQEKCKQIKNSLVDYVLPKEIRKIQKIKAQYKYHFSMDLNPRKLNFYVNNSEDLMYQCKVLVQNFEINKLERIHITGMEPGTLSSFNKRSYWRGPDEICKEVNRMVFPQ